MAISSCGFLGTGMPQTQMQNFILQYIYMKTNVCHTHTCPFLLNPNLAQGSGLFGLLNG